MILMLTEKLNASPNILSASSSGEAPILKGKNDEH